MKTTIKFIFGTFLSILLFSSCLGVDDSSFGKDDDFAFITSDAGFVYAATYGVGPITSPEIREKLQQGQCYFISYKVKTSLGMVNGYIRNAENVSYREDFIPQTNLERKSPEDLDYIPAKVFNILRFSPDTYFGDRWLVGCSAAVKTGERVKAHFYYDPDNQKEDGKDIGTNRVIIDVRFTRTNLSTDTSLTDKDSSFSMAGNFGLLRSMYSPNFDGDGAAQVLIKFRYQRYVSESTSPKIELIGSWVAEEGYIMLFKR